MAVGRPGAGTMNDRFVILEHDHPFLHWDFMLEFENRLRTWRLATPPAPGAVAAEALADHRLEYLNYEGPVGGNRGHVRRWDRGTYTIEAISPDAWIVFLTSGRTRGRVVM